MYVYILLASSALNAHSLSQAAVYQERLQNRWRVVHFRWQTCSRQQQVKSDEFNRSFNFAVMDHTCRGAAPLSFLHRHADSQRVTRCRPRLAGETDDKQANKLAEWLLETVTGTSWERPHSLLWVRKMSPLAWSGWMRTHWKLKKQMKEKKSIYHISIFSHIKNSMEW